MDIKIEDNDTDGFNQIAISKLKELSEQYIKQVIDEAFRIESSRNPNGNKPEVTSEIVTQAEKVCRIGISKKKKKISQLIALLIATISWGLFGSNFDLAKMQASAGVLIFVLVLFVIGFISSTYIFLNED